MSTPPSIPEATLERRERLLSLIRSRYYGATLAMLWEWVWEDYASTYAPLDGKSAAYRCLTRDVAALERRGLVQRVPEGEGRTYRYYDASRPVRRMEAA